MKGMSTKQLKSASNRVSDDTSDRNASPVTKDEDDEDMNKRAG
jgi:hypothetical protein